MGDPRKARKKYQTPAHPWRKERIDAEKELSKTYGLPRKREIWKFSSELNRYKTQAKKLVAIYNEQSKKEQELLIKRLVRYGLLKGSATLDDVLGLDVKDLLERRLQTLVYKKGLARTIDQARQLIVHGHIFVNGQKVTVPSFLVSAEDESKMIFNPRSSFNNEEHPERVIKKQEVKTQTKIEKKEKVNKEEAKEEENGKEEIPAE
ncbi:MAG: 30S ribosomal protein S4 [Candidatus Nanoarchaeia archaeon]|nr:30S ribosomal protein S4 [Candidatus Nanoarchaeia archaeon]